MTEMTDHLALLSMSKNDFKESRRKYKNNERE